MGTPAMNNILPSRNRDLLKNKLTPNTVKTAPAANMGRPIFRLPFFNNLDMFWMDSVVARTTGVGGCDILHS
jgi:hypothetical protein